MVNILQILTATEFKHADYFRNQFYFCSWPICANHGTL